MFLADGKPLDKYFIRFGNGGIAWYAVLIFAGAFLAYKLSQYFGKKRGINPEVYSDLFMICFPIGILGARLWYVVSDLNGMWNAHSFLFDVFESVPGIFNFLANAISIWNGGLAIQGGVIAGVASAYIYFKKKKPCGSFFDLLDTAVPNIFIGQIIGRWGNFVNGEVFGSCVDPEQLSWLPKFILNQQIYATDIYAVCQGKAAIPLFLYEGLINLVGLFLITYVLRKYWKKERYYGDLSALYFVWYGTVRLCLEGLRYQTYIMKIFGIPMSIALSILFIIFGISWLIINRYLAKKKNFNNLVYVDDVEPYVEENKKEEEKKDEE